MGMVWIACLTTDEQSQKLRSDPEAIADFIDSEGAYNSIYYIDLDKQWHAVHYLLTGSVEPVDSPLSLILGKFQECGPDQGYGPATYIPARAVKAFHDALSSLSDEEISSRYDPIAMVRDQVYIGQALADQGKEGVEYLMSDIQRLRKFVAEGAAKSMDAFGLIT